MIREKNSKRTEADDHSGGQPVKDPPSGSLSSAMKDGMPFALLFSDTVSIMKSYRFGGGKI